MVILKEYNNANSFDIWEFSQLVRIKLQFGMECKPEE